MRARALLSSLAAVLLVAAAPARAALTCEGHRITISWQDPGVGKKIVGTNGPDVIQGGPIGEKIFGRGGDDVICGGDGHDDIDGGPGRDELYGQEGIDSFKSSSPDAPLAEDVLAGGPDEDFANYDDKSSVGVRINLASHLVVADGARARGGIQGVENVTGSPFDDELIGNGLNNTLYGGAGDDFLDGRGGSDVLVGGDGVDTLSYASSKQPITVHLADRKILVAGDEDAVGSVEFIVGSDFDDQFYGTDEDDRFSGGKGDDTLRGGKGDDVLEGDAGDDTFYPGPGDDNVDGGTNDPVTNQNHPGDLVSYAHDQVEGDARQFEAYLAPGAQGQPPGSAGVGDDVFRDVESVRGVADKTNVITGSDGPNVLIGGSRTDELVGYKGNDLEFGLGGNDALNGDEGDDFLDGGTPIGTHDADIDNGGDGEDTCLGSTPDFESGCEHTGRD